MTGSPHEIHHVAADSVEGNRRIDDLAQYAGVVVTVGVDPDNPAALANTVTVDDNAPCFLKVATALRALADEFERRHGDHPCDGPS